MYFSAKLMPLASQLTSLPALAGVSCARDLATFNLKPGYLFLTLLVGNDLQRTTQPGLYKDTGEVVRPT